MFFSSETSLGEQRYPLYLIGESQKLQRRARTRALEPHPFPQVISTIAEISEVRESRIMSRYGRLRLYATANISNGACRTGKWYRYHSAIALQATIVLRTFSFGSSRLGARSIL